MEIMLNKLFSPITLGRENLMGDGSRPKAWVGACWVTKEKG